MTRRVPYLVWLDSRASAASLTNEQFRNAASMAATINGLDPVNLTWSLEGMVTTLDPTSGRMVPAAKCIAICKPRRKA